MVVPVDPCKDGSCAIVVKMFGCAFWRSPPPITVVGVGALKPLEMIREPVTMISHSRRAVCVRRRLDG